MFDQREIVLIPFPYSDLTGAKQRPALIISNSRVNSFEDRICCLVTSSPTDQGVKIEKRFFEKGALPFQSWIKPHRLFTIHPKIIRKTLCTLTSEAYELVQKMVIETIKLDGRMKA